MDKNELIELLKKAAEICWDNVNEVEYVDLHNMGEILEGMIDDLETNE
jgi:hypothetical protein